MDDAITKRPKSKHVAYIGLLHNQKWLGSLYCQYRCALQNPKFQCCFCIHQRIEMRRSGIQGIQWKTNECRKKIVSETRWPHQFCIWWLTCKHRGTTFRSRVKWVRGELTIWNGQLVCDTQMHKCATVRVPDTFVKACGQRIDEIVENHGYVCALRICAQSKACVRNTNEKTPTERVKYL